MKRSSWSAVVLGTIFVAVVMAAGAQETRRNRDREPRKGQDEPTRKGMMMRGRMGLGMMPMPMMMEMHRQHASMESQWEATDQGVFVLRPDKLVKYDKDLKLVKSVDLPEQPMPMMPHSDRDGDEARGRPKMPRGMGDMRQMMARMHGALPAKLAVTPDAVLVSRGSRLLKFSRDLELEKSVDLAGVKPMRCPMCGHILESVEGRPQGGQDDEN